ncbi:MAG TPA: metallophosphoesterase [Candidatus Binatia bacterium]|nr:metallophosphoesterase [Candidatus Binatia bacterium]
MRRLACVAVAALTLAGCTFVGGPGSSITGCAGTAWDQSQAAPVGAVSIVALGDFGTAAERRSADVGAALRAFLAQRRITPDAAVLLGDNFYNAGLIGRTHCPCWGGHVDRVAVSRQLDDVLRPFEFLREQTTAYVVPGNHDYGCPKLQAIENETNIDSLLPPERTWGERWQFRAGFPTAATFDDRAQIVFIDSERMIEDGDFLAASVDRMRELLSAGAYRWRLVAGHHPLYTNGPHDGAGWDGALEKALYYPLHLLLFPPFVYGNEGAYEWKYRRYRRELERLFSEHHVDAMLAGHEHALELLAPRESGQPINVVSGSAAKCSPLMRRANTIFEASKNGFAVLTVTAERMRIEFIGTTACEDTKVCAQSVQAGEWHRLFAYDLVQL